MMPYNPSMALQSTTILMGGLNLVAAICILGTIIKFERLRTRTNFLIFNLISCASIYEISQGIVFNIHANVISMRHVNFTIDDICVYVKIKDLLILLISSFANLLALEWYLQVHKPTLFEKFDKFYKFVVGVIYVVNLIGFFFSFWQSCREMPYMVLVAVYLNMLQICVFVVIRFCAEPPTKVRSYPLLTGSLVMLLIIPSFIWRPLMFDAHKRNHSYFTYWILHFLEMILEIPIVYIPVCVGFILLNHDRLFKLAFNKLVKKKILTKEDENELNGFQDEVVVE